MIFVLVLWLHIQSLQYKNDWTSDNLDYTYIPFSNCPFRIRPIFEFYQISSNCKHHSRSIRPLMTLNFLSQIKTQCHVLVAKKDTQHTVCYIYRKNKDANFSAPCISKTTTVYAKFSRYEIFAKQEANGIFAINFCGSQVHHGR